MCIYYSLVQCHDWLYENTVMNRVMISHSSLCSFCLLEDLAREIAIMPGHIFSRMVWGGVIKKVYISRPPEQKNVIFTYIYLCMYVCVYVCMYEIFLVPAVEFNFGLISMKLGRVVDDMMKYRVIIHLKPICPIWGTLGVMELWEFWKKKRPDHQYCWNSTVPLKIFSEFFI